MNKININNKFSQKFKFHRLIENYLTAGNHLVMYGFHPKPEISLNLFSAWQSSERRCSKQTNK